MEKFFEKYTTLYENDVITTTVRISRAEDHAVWKHSPPEFPSNVKLTAACWCTGHNSEHRARFRTPGTIQNPTRALSRGFPGASHSPWPFCPCRQLRNVHTPQLPSLHRHANGGRERTRNLPQGRVSWAGMRGQTAWVSSLSS